MSKKVYLSGEMKLPTDLIQRMQGDYVASKYRDGVFTFLNIDEATINQLLSSMVFWAEEKGLIEENKMDISSLKGV